MDATTTPLTSDCFTRQPFRLRVGVASNGQVPSGSGDDAVDVGVGCVADVVISDYDRVALRGLSPPGPSVSNMSVGLWVGTIELVDTVKYAGPRDGNEAATAVSRNDPTEQSAGPPVPGDRGPQRKTG